MLLLKNLLKYCSLLAVLLLLTASHTTAQFYNGSQMEFGKNRVQFNKFEWSFYRFDKFDVYFYVGGHDQAVYAMRASDKIIEDLEKKLDYTMTKRFQIIVYNRLSDLRQSNIGAVTEESYNTGGVTHIVDKKLMLYFNGDYEDFERQLKAGLVKVMVNNMMYGGKLKDVIRNNTLLNIPPWFTDGLISYLSRDWDPQINNAVKDGVMSGRWEKFNRLEGREATDAGHSIWKYIVENYGTSVISNILYMTRISRNVDSGLMFVLGVSLKNLTAEWLNYYDKMFYKQEQKLSLPEEKPLNRIRKKPRPNKVIGEPVFSKNGQFLAYKRNEEGRIKVCVRDLETGKDKVIYRQDYRSHNLMDLSYPVMSFHPSGKLLAIVTEHKGKIKLMLHDLENNKRDVKEIFYFRKVTSIDYSDNGKDLAMTAVLEGRSDLFIYNIISNTYKRITNDMYTDRDASFIDGSSKIIFSSNRDNDTIQDIEMDILPGNRNFDLFIFEKGREDKVLRRVTQTSGIDEIMPTESGKGKYTYLSDANGTLNRFVGELDSVIAYIDTITHYNYFTTTRPLTDLPRNITSYAVDTVNKKVVDVVLAKGNYRLTLRDLEAPNSNLTLKNSGFKKKGRDNAALTNTAPPPTIGQVSSQPIKAEPAKPFDPDNVDIFNYQFDEEIIEQEKKTETTAKNENAEPKDGSAGGNMSDRMERKLAKAKGKSKAQMRIDSLNAALQSVMVQEKKFELPQQRYYHVAFFADGVVTQLDNNFVNSSYQRYTGSGGFVNPGLNGLFKIGISDLFEDYKVIGGIRIAGNLNSTEYFLTAQNFKRRLDQSLTFHRQSFENQTGVASVQKFQMHSLLYRLTWPFTEFSAFKATMIARNDRTIFLSTNDRSLEEPDDIKFLAGIKSEYIFDNTINRGLNLYEGTRLKVFSEFYQDLDGDAKNFAVVGADVRNYLPLHRELTWANRIAASTNFGSNKLVYYMGGVDEWIVPSFNNDIEVDQSQNYQFQSLATNMRGFQQNIRNGTSFIVVNSELRVPLFRYIFNRPMKSDFLYNFQIVGFGDIGTAWTGISPFSEDNNLNREEIQAGSTQIILRNRREPVVGGFGLGIRARVLGYFVRVDHAWGVENGIVNDGIWYVSLSLDF